MSKQIIKTDKAPNPVGPYSQAVKINLSGAELVYSAGQVGLNPATGKMVEGGIKEQTRQALENLSAILNEAGTELTKVIKSTIFIKNMNDFASMNEVYATYFGKSIPARSTVEVSRLPVDALVEIEVIAYV